jgi:hypothetical protein
MIDKFKLTLNKIEHAAYHRCCACAGGGKEPRNCANEESAGCRARKPKSRHSAVGALPDTAASSDEVWKPVAEHADFGGPCVAAAAAIVTQHCGLQRLCCVRPARASARKQ